MDKKHKLVLIPNYVGSFEHKVDHKGRFSLPSIIRRTISERNEYNALSSDFEVMCDLNGDYAIAFKGVPFAAPKPNEAVTKKDLDISGLDKLVYVATGTIRDARPEFLATEADVVFVYAITDAQRILYDKRWMGSGFASNHRIAKIEGDGRIKLTPFEQSICVNSDHIILPPRESADIEIIKNPKYIVVTGHPSLFCATLTNRYQPTL